MERKRPELVYGQDIPVVFGSRQEFRKCLEGIDGYVRWGSGKFFMGRDILTLALDSIPDTLFETHYLVRWGGYTGAISPNQEWPRFVFVEKGDYILQKRFDRWPIYWNSPFGSMYVSNDYGTDANRLRLRRTNYGNYNRITVTVTIYCLSSGALEFHDINTTTATESYTDLDLPTYMGFYWNTYATDSIIDDPLDPGGTNEDDENSGSTPGDWTTPHSGEKDDHTGYNDLEASLFRVYALNKRQMSALSQSIWNPNVLTAVLQKIGGIEKLIIGLYSYPFEVNHEGSEININFNWLDAWADGVQAKGYQVTQEYQQINFGNIEIPNFSGTFYDYQPFSTAQLYIPYIGFIPLKMNEIIGCKLNLKFNINVCTGDFCAVVSVLDKKDPLTGQNYNMTIGMYNGNISRPLPLSRQEMFEVYKAGATLLGATAGAVMGAKTAMTGQMDLNKYLGNYETLKGQVEAANSYAHQYNSMRQNPDYNDGRNMAYVRPPEKNTKPYLDEITRGSRQAGSSMANAISAVTQANAPIERSGNLGGVVGRCSTQKAFILISYPHQNIPKNQNILGYATNAQGPLSNGFSGYTEVREIRIKDSNATSSELAEIEKIVKGGIII